VNTISSIKDYAEAELPRACVSSCWLRHRRVPCHQVQFLSLSLCPVGSIYLKTNLHRPSVIKLFRSVSSVCLSFEPREFGVEVNCITIDTAWESTPGWARSPRSSVEDTELGTQGATCWNTLRMVGSATRAIRSGAML